MEALFIRPIYEDAIRISIKPAGAHIHLHLVVQWRMPETTMSCTVNVGWAQQLLEGLLPASSAQLAHRYRPAGSVLRPSTCWYWVQMAKAGSSPFGVDAGRILKGKLLPQGWRQRFVKMAEVIQRLSKVGFSRVSESSSTRWGYSLRKALRDWRCNSKWRT